MVIRVIFYDNSKEELRAHQFFIQKSIPCHQKVYQSAYIASESIS